MAKNGGPAHLSTNNSKTKVVLNLSKAFSSEGEATLNVVGKVGSSEASLLIGRFLALFMLTEECIPQTVLIPVC